MNNIVDIAKLSDLLGKKEEEKKKCNVLLWVFAIIGIVVAVAGIAYAVYRYFEHDYLDDFEDDFEDDYEDDEDDFYEDETEE